MDDKRNMVTEVESMRKLGRTEMFSCMRVGISVCVVAVVVLVVVVVLVRVKRVVFLGARFLSLVEVECLAVVFWLMEVDIFELGGVLTVKAEVETFELVLRCSLELVLWFLDSRGIFL